ncbi:MAG: hypothetical protein HS111_05465 [Kofleriaceae bacterium]|nr:hypothetical protein [Kofleriaceae bacterium]
MMRIAVPLAILGFMSSRIVHADHWIGDAGFIVPDLGGDWRQPVPWRRWRRGRRGSWSAPW